MIYLRAVWIPIFLQLANESLRFYKGIEAPHDKPINSDPIALIESVDKNEEKLKNSTDDHDENDLNSPLTFKDFCKYYIAIGCCGRRCLFNCYFNLILRVGTPHAKKSLAIAVVMEFLAYISGTLTMISFITWIFNETGSYLSEKDSSILVSITQLTANGLFISIVDRFNRRVCSDNLKFVEVYCLCSQRLTDVLFWCVLCRHFTYGHRYSQHLLTFYSDCMVIYGLNSPDSNGCHRWQWVLLFLRVVWAWSRCHTWSPLKYSQRR